MQFEVTADLLRLAPAFTDRVFANRFATSNDFLAFTETEIPAGQTHFCLQTDKPSKAVRWKNETSHEDL